MRRSQIIENNYENLFEFAIIPFQLENGHTSADWTDAIGPLPLLPIFVPMSGPMVCFLLAIWGKGNVPEKWRRGDKCCHEGQLP